MKISFVSIEDGITALGFRKMASFARSIHPSTEVCYLPLTNAYNPLRFLFKPGEHDRVYSDADLNSIASHFAKSDLVCFSSMTAYSDLTKEIIQLTTEDPEKSSKAQEVVSGEFSGEDLTVGYNASYLKDILSHIDDETVIVKLKTSISAALFYPGNQKENTELTMLLMPIRLNN